MASTVGDIMINITANGSQVAEEMAKIKNQIKQTINDSYNTVKNGTKKSEDAIGDSAKNSSDSVIEEGKKIRNDNKETSDSFKQTGKESTSSGEKTGSAWQRAGGRISQAGKTIKKSLKTDAALAFAAVGSAALGFAKQCISAAIQSESAWTRFGALVNQNGGNWEKQKNDVKGWARTFSNEVGYAVSDTREASMTLMQMGLQSKDLGVAMKGVAGLAARAGITEAEASKVVASAMAGRAGQLKKLTGLSIDNYKASNGQVDTLRLLTDLYKQNEEALRKHGETTEAQLTRLDNSWGMLKTQIGQALMPVLRLLADVLGVVVDAFTKMPDGVKTIIGVFLLVGGAVGVVIGALGMLAPGLIAIGELIGGMAGAVALLTNPITIAIAVILALVVVLDYLYNNNEQVRNAMQGFASWLESGFASVWQALQPVFQGLGRWIGEVGQSIYNMLVPAFQNVVQFCQPLLSVLGDLWNAFGQLWNALTGTDTTGATTGFNFLAAAADLLAKAVQVVAQQIIGGLQVAFAIIIPVLSLFGKLIVIAVTNLSRVLGVFSDLIQGNISLGEAFGQLGDIVSEATLSIVGAIGGTLLDIWDNLVQIAGQKLSELPGVIATEIGNIASAIDPAIAMGAIIAFGGELVDAFLGALGIASPGTMAQKMGEEMGHIAEYILNGIGNVISAIVQFGISIVTGFINALIGLPAQVGMYFNQVGLDNTCKARIHSWNGRMLVNAIRNAIVTRFNLIVARVRAIFMNIVTTIRSRLTQAFASAGQLAGRIRQVIQTKLQLIVNKVRGIFSQVVSNIRSRLSNAVSTAREKAMEIYNNIKNKISEIPQIVADEFGKIPGKITSALASAASAAASGARDIVSRFASALGIASPGYVQRMTEAEFKSLPMHIRDSGFEAVYQTREMAKNIVNAWERNMDTMTIPIEQFDAFNPSFASDSLLSSENVALLRTDLTARTGGTFGAGTVRTTSNNSVTNDNSSIVYEIQNINLEMGNLTKEQSRKVLYEALDGLYTGGT